MAQTQTQTQTQRPCSSILDSLGEEIVRIIAPVSICMFLVVILVSVLNTKSPFDPSMASIVTIAYTETTSDSTWDKFLGALLNSLAFVVVVTVVTFVLVLLFYFRCTRFLKLYMAFSAFVVLGFLGGEVSLFLIQHFSTPLDCITFSLVLCNFAVVGVLAVFMSKMAIFVTQGYLVVIGMLVAYWFTMLPEWTTWAMLVAMALYDLAAVLLPIGPLRLLVELAISRDEEIPALVYEARPVNHGNLSPRDVVQRRLWRDRQRRHENSILQTDYSNTNANSVLAHSPNAESQSDSDAIAANNRDGANLVRENASSNPNLNDNSNTSSGSYSYRNLVSVEEGRARVQETDSDLSAPLIDRGMNVQLGRVEDATSSENLLLEGIGLGSSGAIKLGLGDFIFYSVLVGRAAMYDFMTVYACYLAIIAGLGITLMLLALYQKALPALPVSIALGVLFYFLTRLLLEVFVVQCSLNLLLF
ncbi:presenilin-like protein At2g29900 [Cajanus cajan]|uniref:presenilin-like protein At2g29900 n=1 Tax=Cajanus cajan TaxID=3821 RepID=UPI00098D9B1C|nr:presenilin-like protein At2g29900 [Cajanus cajan]